MALRENIEKQGAWLFKHRSYLPLLTVPILFFALKEARVLAQMFGDSASDFWEAFSIMLSLVGLLVRGITAGYVPKGTSGRNTKWQVAETLNTTGMYSIVRNPLYLGNFIIIFGITLFIQSWWFALLVWISFWLYYERIIFTEEEFLRKKFNGQFTEWAAMTPAITPNFKNWVKPTTHFSLKTALRREFSTFFAIVSTYFFLEITNNFLTKRKLLEHRSWMIFFIAGFVVYSVFLILKKKTKLLNVAGR